MRYRAIRPSALVWLCSALIASCAGAADRPLGDGGETVDGLAVDTTPCASEQVEDALEDEDRESDADSYDADEEASSARCGGEVVQQGEACEQDHECEAAMVCQGCQCVARACEADEDCDDDNPCTRNTCVDERCQRTALDDVPCPDDGAVCTADLCVQGACKHPVTAFVPCDDGDPCTLDTVCDEGGNCVGPVPGDKDDDNVPDPCDDCPDDWDPLQEDFDNDGIGEACDDLPGPWSSCPAISPPFYDYPEGSIQGDLALFEGSLGPLADGVCPGGVPPFEFTGADGVLEFLVPRDSWLAVGLEISGQLPLLHVLTGCHIGNEDGPVCYGSSFDPATTPVGALPDGAKPTSPDAWRRSGYEVKPDAPGEVVSVWFDTARDEIIKYEPQPVPYKLHWRLTKAVPAHDSLATPLPLTPGTLRRLESWRHGLDSFDAATCTLGGEGLGASADLAYRIEGAAGGKKLRLELDPWNVRPSDLAGHHVRLLRVNDDGRCEAAEVPDDEGGWIIDDLADDARTIVIEAGNLAHLLADLRLLPLP